MAISCYFNFNEKQFENGVVRQNSQVRLMNIVATLRRYEKNYVNGEIAKKVACSLETVKTTMLCVTSLWIAVIFLC